MYLCQPSCALCEAYHKKFLTQFDWRNLYPTSPPENEFENIMIPFFTLISNSFDVQS